MTQDEIILEIAKEHFQIDTLKPMNLDRFDFHDVSVVAMKRALEAAYKAGQESK